MDNHTKSDHQSNNVYFNSWNKGLKEGRLDFHEPINFYKKFSSFDYSKYLKVEDPLKITEEKMKDLVTGKIDKIFVTISGTLHGLFQLSDNKEKFIDIVPDKSNSDWDYFDYFFGGYFTENKNVYYGSLNIIQHQEVSVKWFIEVLKLKQLEEESGEFLEDDHSLIGKNNVGFLNWYFEMVAFADEIGLNSSSTISDEEMGLIRHGVSLSYQNLFGDKNTLDIAAAAACSEFVGGDIEEEVYFKYTGL